LPRQCSSRNLDPIRRPSSSDRLAPGAPRAPPALPTPT
jgi:hypothetical protein